MKLIRFLTTVDSQEEPVNRFLVVHPLDDVPEQKFDAGNLGPIAMTTAVRVSLLALRAYLVVMMLLVIYHVLGLAGLFAHPGQ